MVVTGSLMNQDDAKPQIRPCQGETGKLMLPIVLSKFFNGERQ
jgi:hypothetical protein